MASDFKNRLKEARTKKGFSQSELAKMVGVHVTNISRYERGENKPTSDVLAKLANALDTTVDFLMSGSLDERAESGISDRELLSLFKKAEKLPEDKKTVIKEVINSIVITNSLQQQLNH